MSNTSAKRSRTTLKDGAIQPQPMVPASYPEHNDSASKNSRESRNMADRLNLEDVNRYSISSVDESLWHVGVGAGSDMSSIHSAESVIYAPQSRDRNVSSPRNRETPVEDVIDSTGPPPGYDLDRGLTNLLKPLLQMMRSPILSSNLPRYFTLEAPLDPMEQQRAILAWCISYMRETKTAEVEETRSQLSRYMELDTALKLHKEEFQAKRQEIEELNSVKDGLRRECAELRKENRGLKKIDKGHRRRLEIRKQKIAKRRRETHLLQDEVKELKTALRNSNKAVAESEGRARASNDLLSEMMENLEGQGKETERQKMYIAGLEKQLEANKDAFEDQRENLEAKKIHVETLQPQLEEALQCGREEKSEESEGQKVKGTENMEELIMARELAEARLEIKSLDDELQRIAFHESFEEMDRKRVMDWIQVLLMMSIVLSYYAFTLF